MTSPPGQPVADLCTHQGPSVGSPGSLSRSRDIQFPPPGKLSSTPFEAWSCHHRVSVPWSYQAKVMTLVSVSLMGNVSVVLNYFYKFLPAQGCADNLG